MTYIPFGKYGSGSADAREPKEIPSGYLRWWLEQDNLVNDYPDLTEEIEEELEIRDRSDAHFEEADWDVVWDGP